MICTEAAEFVSALCDGEIIPPTAAEHIGTCPACQARLRDYLNLGVELRRTASLEQFDHPRRFESTPLTTFGRAHKTRSRHSSRKDGEPCVFHASPLPP